MSGGRALSDSGRVGHGRSATDGIVNVLSHVPWWGWALLCIHITYRLCKIWRMHSPPAHARGEEYDLPNVEL
eukprot:352176-Chlamydomonas_euryale.AAC.3